MDQQKGYLVDGDAGEKLAYISDQIAPADLIQSAKQIEGQPVWVLHKSGQLYLNSAYLPDSACSAVSIRPFSGWTAAIRNLIARLRFRTPGRG